MAETQSKRELKKAIRSQIRLRFSVAAERAINRELEKLEQVEARGEQYVLDLDAILDGIGDPNKAIQGVTIDETQALPW